MPGTQHACALDPTKSVDQDRWAVTLITDSGGTKLFLGKHVQIFCERVDDKGVYIAEIYHLTGISYIPVINIGRQTGERVSSTNIASRIQDGKRVRTVNKTQTFILEKFDVELMLKRIEDSRETSTFHILGRHSFFTTPYRYLGFMKDNCFTWALDKVYFAGLKFPEYISNWVLYSDPKNSIREGVQLIEEFTLIDLCKLAKEGANEVIKRRFPNMININKLTGLRHPEGAVELVLGYYTPLALAVAYNQLETVKLLCEEYGADVNVLNGADSNYTALDCAMNGLWGFVPQQLVSSKCYDNMKNYLIERGAKTYHQMQCEKYSIRETIGNLIEILRNATVFLEITDKNLPVPEDQYYDCLSSEYWESQSSENLYNTPDTVSQCSHTEPCKSENSNQEFISSSTEPSFFSTLKSATFNSIVASLIPEILGDLLEHTKFLSPEGAQHVKRIANLLILFFMGSWVGTGSSFATTQLLKTMNFSDSTARLAGNAVGFFASTGTPTAALAKAAGYLAGRCAVIAEKEVVRKLALIHHQI